MIDTKDAERARIRAELQELEANGISIYKVAVLLGEPYNTVKHWAKTGSVESYYAGVIGQLKRLYCPPLAGACLISHQTTYCEISHIETCT